MTVETNEFRVFGPPGTGKTSYLARQIENARRVHGSDRIFVTSFTRAAALEIASRDGVSLPKASVGTLHAHCYRNLDYPELAENHVTEFNAEFPDFAITNEVDVDDPFAVQPGMAPSAKTYQEMNRLRSLMIPPEMWPMDVRILFEKWDAWKRGNNLLDFTDLLEINLRDVPYAPQRPVVGFIDEAQDMTPLQFSIVRKWGKDMETFVLVGDEDQCLYQFAGATPNSLLDPPLPDEKIIILGQSHRVPRAVLEWASKIISRVERRQAKEYKPRQENGEEIPGKIRLSSANAMEPSSLLLEVESDLKRDKRIMVLGSCAYMLVPFLKMLRAEGIPYHNPYRRKQGAWNPLHASRGVSSAERLAAFMRFSKDVWGESASSTWTTDDLNKWIPVVNSDVLQYGIKTKIKKAPSSHKFRIDEIFEDDSGLIMVFGNEEAKLKWFEENLTATGRSKMEYPLRILKRDKSNLRNKPKIIIGTIHSVKGGEADVVYVLPDLARPQVMAWNGNSESRDALRRLYYVAGTRAREELVLCTPSYGVNGFPLMEGLS
jgi:DNA helicase-2/ATP-dependent DNA helicase PcrA